MARDTIPEGLTIEKYSDLVCAQANIIIGLNLRGELGQAIEIIAKEESCPISEATARILERICAARAVGERQWTFWIRDEKWRERSAPKKASALDGMVFDNVRPQ